MKQVSGKQFARLLQKQGWMLIRVNGSHHIFTKVGRPERIVIPIHANRPLKIGLLKNQMKIAGITENDF